MWAQARTILAPESIAIHLFAHIDRKYRLGHGYRTRRDKNTQKSRLCQTSSDDSCHDNGPVNTDTKTNGKAACFGGAHLNGGAERADNAAEPKPHTTEILDTRRREAGRTFTRRPSRSKDFSPARHNSPNRNSDGNIAQPKRFVLFVITFRRLENVVVWRLLKIPTN